MLDKNNIIDQSRAAAKKWPTLKLSIIDSIETACELRGPWTLDAEFNSIRIAKRYSLRIVIPQKFPQEIPAVYETSSAITPLFSHRFEDGRLCLGTCSQVALDFEQNPSIVHLIEGPMTSCLYSEAFLERYGLYPFGDREHGISGTLSFIKELFDVKTNAEAFGLLKAIATENYHGHEPCPCGSEIRGRDCHGPLLIRTIHSAAIWGFRQDYHFVKTGLMRLKVQEVALSMTKWTAEHA